MKRIAAFVLILVLMLAPVMGAAAETAGEQEARKAVKAYFDMRYKILSTLVFDDGLRKLISPEILNSKDILNEADILDLMVRYRKVQANDLTFDRFKFTLDNQTVRFEGNKAWVSLNENFELYFKCAPTVKNSGVINHMLTFASIEGKWLLVNDDYYDNDGIKKKLYDCFQKNGVSKETAKKMVLADLENQANARLGKLKDIMKGTDRKLFVFFNGRNAAYAYGSAERIDTKTNITPEQINGTTYLPLTFTGEKLGYKVKLDSRTSTAGITGKAGSISIKAGDRYFTKGGKKSALSSPARMVKGCIMLSSGDMARVFGKKLYADGKGLTILGDNQFDGKKNAALVAELEEYFSVLFTKVDFPRIDGSTATYPLSIEMGKLLLGLDETGAKGFITHNTTHNAYVNLINRDADIIFVTPPSEDELQLARKSGVELEVIPICKEGFVFLVNKENKVDNLTVKQVQDIYQGKIKNWSEVGGEDNVIIPYQREANSGSQTLMESVVMKGLKLMQPPKETLVYGMGELIDRVAQYSNAKNALGYSVFYYATQMYQSGNIKLLSINGVKPEKQTIKSGKYPFTTSYYAVIRKNEPKDSNTRKLLKWVLGKEGQGIVDKAGFVPVK